MQPGTVDLDNHAIHGNFDIEVGHGGHSLSSHLCVSDCSLARVNWDRTTYELLFVWEAPPEALNKPQLALAAMALADSWLKVSLESLDRDALQATCVAC